MKSFNCNTKANGLNLLRPRQIVVTTVTKCSNIKQPDFPQKFPNNYTHQFLLKTSCFFKQPKQSQNIWASFAIKFVSKNFHKSPNLVTYVVTQNIFVSFPLVRIHHLHDSLVKPTQVSLLQFVRSNCVLYLLHEKNVWGNFFSTITVVVKEKRNK